MNSTIIRSFILFLSISFARPGLAGEKLILVGGAEYPAPAMKRFVEWAGGQKSKILIVTWGGMGHVDSTRSRLKRHLSSQGAMGFLEAPLPEEMKTQVDVFRKQLASASGVFFTGGDQLSIMKVIDDYRIRTLLVEKFSSGVVFGGASAGTAIMAERMLTGESAEDEINPNKIATAEGLGLAKGIAIDQHFIERKRQNRLQALIAGSDYMFGIGVDETSAVSIENGNCVEVLGDSWAHVFKKTSVSPLRFEVSLLKLNESLQLN